MIRPISFCFVLLLSICSELSAEPVLLKNFSELLDALTRGERVVCVIHYADCKVTTDGKEGKSSNQIGSIPMLPFEYYGAGVITPKAFISVSSTVMVYLPGANGFIDNYVKVRVYDDNSVNILDKFISADKLETKMEKVFDGEVNDGSNGKGVYFYIQK